MKGNFKYLWALAIPALLASCGRSPESTGIEYAPQMYHTIALEPYTQIQDSIAPFKDGMNAQPSVAGTIPRDGWADYPYALNDSAFMTQANPVKWSEENKAQSELLYNRYCGICHGKKGAGDGKVAEKDEINPPNFGEDRLKKFTSGQFYHTIYYGKGVMGSYASQLTHNERWMIVNYVEELQGKHAAPVADSTAAAPADTAAAPEAPAPDAKPAPTAKGGAKPQADKPKAH